MNKNNIPYISLFSTFFKIGLFTIGGGYAMIPLIEADVVKRRKWIEENDFIDLLAIAQSAPGVFAVNISIFIGYKLRGVKGSIISALANVLPSILIILSIALFFNQFRTNRWVEYLFMGLRPAVVALIAVPVLSIAKSSHITLKTVWIPIITATLIVFLNISPVYAIIFGGIGGYLWGKYKTKEV